MENNTSHKEKDLVFLLRELNNPLTNILISIDILENSALNTDSSLYYAIIKKNAAVLGRALREICDREYP